jgi:hypothetical protein
MSPRVVRRLSVLKERVKSADEKADPGHVDKQRDNQACQRPSAMQLRAYDADPLSRPGRDCRASGTQFYDAHGCLRFRGDVMMLMSPVQRECDVRHTGSSSLTQQQLRQLGDA